MVHNHHKAGRAGRTQNILESTSGPNLYIPTNSGSVKTQWGQVGVGRPLIPTNCHR